MPCQHRKTLWKVHFCARFKWRIINYIHKGSPWLRLCLPRGAAMSPGQTQADLVLLEASHTEPLSAGNLWKARDCVGMEVLITDHCISLTTGRINIFNKWFRFHAKSRWILSLKTTYYIPQRNTLSATKIRRRYQYLHIETHIQIPSNWLADHNWSLQ